MGKCTEHQRDIYYRKAKELGFRARSAFKLLQLDDEFEFLNGVDRAVDLCAAPGSWSQVLSRKLYENETKAQMMEKTKIVSVDLQEMAPIPGVRLLQGDITNTQTAEQIIACFLGEKAQLVICDGAPDVTGVHDIDEYVQSELLLAALCITTHILEEHGTFVAKIFRRSHYDLLESQLSVFFDRVSCSKPDSSRSASMEAFVVCQGFRMPSNYTPHVLSQYKPNYGVEAVPLTEFEERIIPFTACGDLSGFDIKQ